MSAFWSWRTALHRMFLHAFRISFIDPASGRQVKVEAPLPPELEQILTQLRTLQASGIAAST